MSVMIDLAGRKALVTGVSRGIGASIARKLAEAGCDVAGCATRAEDSVEARAFIQSVEELGRRACYLQADLADPAVPERLVARSVEALGGLDILISNAGRNVFKGAAECTESDWEHCMNLDLASHWRLARSAKSALERAEHPVILVISSNHAWSTIPGCFPYNVAKAGLGAMVQSLAIEWGPKIRAVGIAPGFIATDANQLWYDRFPDPAAERRRTENRHPVGRVGTADEVGMLCAYLASPAAGFINGTTICIDGGRSALMQDP